MPLILYLQWPILGLLSSFLADQKTIDAGKNFVPHKNRACLQLSDQKFVSILSVEVFIDFFTFQVSMIRISVRQGRPVNRVLTDYRAVSDFRTVISRLLDTDGRTCMFAVTRTELQKSNIVRMVPCLIPTDWRVHRK